MDTLILNKDGTPLSIVPLSVVTWQVAIRLLVSDKVKTLEEYDNWAVRSPSVTMNVPSIVMTTDYIKWNKQVKYNRTNIYLRDNFTCQYCGTTPGVNGLTLDHVLPRHKGGKTNWTNITTACQECNSEKGHNHNIVPKHKPVRPTYYEIVSKRLSYPIKIKEEKWIPYLPWKNDLIILKENNGKN